ncbi:MAG: efflux RND transporter periplasmic adaptor subunit [Spirochaetota bacterium]|nr:efflux RND transporter periplasmic adaptor subunit [Spirochaetota bacterium]
MKKRIIFIFIIVLLVGLVAYRLIVRFSSKDVEEVFTKVPVKAVAAKRMDMVDKMKLTGNIIGTEVVKVFPQVPGKIHSILLEEGQKVNKGKTLFKINRDIVGMDYKLAIVESPITGYVGEIMVDKGMSVSPKTALAQIVNMSTVEAEVRLMEEDINRVTLGMQGIIKVEAFPNRVFYGKVYKKSAVLDEASRTQEIRIKILNPKLSLRHGMFADVEIIIGKKSDIIVVPEDSIFKTWENEKSINSVYLVKNNKAVLQKVMTGLTNNNYIEIRSGLKQGDVVVTLGIENLSHGDELIVYREDEDVNTRNKRGK